MFDHSSLSNRTIVGGRRSEKKKGERSSMETTDYRPFPQQFHSVYFLPSGVRRQRKGVKGKKGKEKGKAVYYTRSYSSHEPVAASMLLSTSGPWGSGGFKAREGRKKKKKGEGHIQPEREKRKKKRKKEKVRTRRPSMTRHHLLPRFWGASGSGTGDLRCKEEERRKEGMLSSNLARIAYIIVYSATW